MEGDTSAGGKHTGEQQSKSRKPADYTAILYFHGMGTPRRHEEISRLTDALDQFAERQDIASVGRLRNQSVIFEPSRTDQEDDVAYVRVLRVVRRFGSTFKPEGIFRIYEGFWSASAAGGYSAPRVLVWLLLRIFSPFKVLFSPWRAYQRLRLTTLYRMYSEFGSVGRAFETLESAYREFENWPARRRFPLGSIGNFRRYVREKFDSRRRMAIEALLHAWIYRFRREQFLVIATSTTFLVGIAAVLVGACFLAANWAEALIPSEVQRFPVLLRFVAVLRPHNYALWEISMLLLWMLLVARYQLSNFWSDVMFWSIQKEKDLRYWKRKEILRAGERILQHVLRDPSCTRVVVIGHSLGAAIAHECLMRLGRRKRAWGSSSGRPVELDRLDRISHFITIGSPIDKLYYFFETHGGGGHRYNRISEQIRGDTGDPPFSIDRTQATQWVNIWDNADPVSSELYSPRKRIPNRNAIIDRRTMSSHRPNFLKAHNEYLFSYTAMRVVFWVAIFGRMPTDDGESDQLRARLQSIAATMRHAGWCLVFLCPWLTAFFEAAVLAKIKLVPTLIFACVSMVVGLAMTLQVLGYFMDRARPTLVSSYPTLEP